MIRVILVNFMLTAIILTGAIFYFDHSLANPLQRAWKILKPDPTLGWIQKSHLNTLFEGYLVHTDALGFRNEFSFDEGKNSSVLLGPSSAFGWGVADNETYSSLLNQAGHPIYNASVIGFSTYQGQVLFNSLFSKSSKIKNLILAYGINDLDYYRFYDNTNSADSAYFHAEKLYSKTVEWLSKFTPLYGLLRLFLDSHFYSGCGISSIPVRRLSLDDSMAITENLINSAQQRNIHILLVGTAYSLPKRFSQPDLRMPTYNAAVELSQTGRCKESFQNYTENSALEPIRIKKDVATYNKALELLAISHKVDFINVADALKQESYFFDPVHPNSKGHKIIADLLLEKIEKNGK